MASSVWQSCLDAPDGAWLLLVGEKRSSKYEDITAIESRYQRHTSHTGQNQSTVIVIISRRLAVLSGELSTCTDPLPQLELSADHQSVFARHDSPSVIEGQCVGEGSREPRYSLSDMSPDRTKCVLTG